MTPQARRQDLIAAALELFGSRPPEDVSVDDVVRRAGVSRPLFYRYFSSIRELHLAALRSVTDGLIDRLAGHEDGPPTERLRAAVRGLIEVAGEYRAGYVALLRSGSVVATSETNAVVDLLRHRAVEVILDDTVITEPSPLLLATLRCWTAVVEGALLTWLQDGIPRQVELDRWLVDQLVAMVTATAAYDPAAADLLIRCQSSSENVPTRSRDQGFLPDSRSPLR